MNAVKGFCRDCLTESKAEARRCNVCGSPRLLRHDELDILSIAHIDCDAFYASVEKRDNPDLRDKPVIVGGAERGVVSTCCYIARVSGVKSAMPMFKAKALCPEAVIVRPNMAKYAKAAKEVRMLMEAVTPLVQPVSIDEAFLDLTGTQRLHGATPAQVLARLILRIEKEVGVTASVGLSHNKFLAKLASDMQKPRGFSVIGKAETLQLLAARPVGSIWGVGKAMQEKLERRGITMIGQLQKMERDDLARQFGSMGFRLYHLSRGEDLRVVETHDEAKSISAENTFFEDLSDYQLLEKELWPLCQRISRRAKKDGLCGRTITLKLKTNDFASRTRAVSVADGTNQAHEIFEAGKNLLKLECGRAKFRLIGIGLSRLVDATAVSESGLDATFAARSKAEAAMDKIRDKFGRDAVDRGIGFKKV